jgi:hypothetical protein
LEFRCVRGCPDTFAVVLYVIPADHRHRSFHTEKLALGPPSPPKTPVRFLFSGSYNQLAQYNPNTRRRSGPSECSSPQSRLPSHLIGTSFRVVPSTPYVASFVSLSCRFRETRERPIRCSEVFCCFWRHCPQDRCSIASSRPVKGEPPEPLIPPNAKLAASMAS